MSSIKVRREPNDEKKLIFNDDSKSIEHKKHKKPICIVSPIRQHIKEANEKLKTRVKLSSTSNRMGGSMNHQLLRDKRRAAITPHASSSSKWSATELNQIVARISQSSVLFAGGFPSTRTPFDAIDVALNAKLNKQHLNAKHSPEAVRLMAKIPEWDDSIPEREEEEERSCNPTKAQQRERNPWIDKSLPWVQDVIESSALEAAPAKQIKAAEDGKSLLEESHNEKKRETVCESSAIKKNFKEIIASKLRIYKPPPNDSFEESASSSGSASKTSLSTNFSNDSGSFVQLEGNRKVHSSALKSTKFEVCFLQH